MGWIFPVLFALARAPHLWLTAARQVVRLAPRGWWHRWPLLPLPDHDYLRFRLQTMYGGEGRSPDAADVLAVVPGAGARRQDVVAHGGCIGIGARREGR